MNYEIDVEDILSDQISKEGMFEVINTLVTAFETCWEVEGYDAVTANKVLKHLRKACKALM